MELDRQVGQAESSGLTLVGDAVAVRAFDGGALRLRAQAPALSVEVTGVREPQVLTVEVENAARGARVLVSGREVETEVSQDGSTLAFQAELDADALITLAPPDLEDDAPFVFAVLSDVQSGIDDVSDVFARMNADPELRFVVSTGDLVDTGTRAELTQFLRELEALRIPFYSTVGNHEQGAPPKHWHELFGLFNTHFTFHGVHFSLVDSGNATIDPAMYDILDGWLQAARDAVHVLVTHVPPLDPAGLRGGAFRSRKEAAKFIQKLGRGQVDALFLGHIHSYYAFSSAGVPSYISGGGGATEERFDGISRHYLRVRASASRGVEDVAVVRID